MKFGPVTKLDKSFDGDAMSANCEKEKEEDFWDLRKTFVCHL